MSHSKTGPKIVSIQRLVPWQTTDWQACPVDEAGETACTTDNACQHLVVLPCYCTTVRADLWIDVALAHEALVGVKQHVELRVELPVIHIPAHHHSPQTVKARTPNHQALHSPCSHATQPMDGMEFRVKGLAHRSRPHAHHTPEHRGATVPHLFSMFRIGLCLPASVAVNL